MIRNSATEMAAKLAAGETTSVALTQAHLDRIAAVDADVHAFLYVDKVVTACRCTTCA
jgi:aspartyl-tRNA(Asn)/glutamyl-tRNA(Gln) amidotransferase subunit A